MAPVPVLPDVFDRHYGADPEYPSYLKGLCAEIGLPYDSKQGQRVAVYTQPLHTGSLYTRDLHQWRRDEVEDLQDAAQKMAGDGYVVKIEKAGPDTRTPAQKIWDGYHIFIIAGVIIFGITFLLCLCACCVECCSSMPERRAARQAKRARKRREREERRARREPRMRHLRKKSRTSTIGEIEMGNLGQVITHPQNNTWYV